VHGRHQCGIARDVGTVQYLAAVLCDAKVVAQQCLGGGRSEQLLAVAEDDDVGVIGVDDDVVMRTPRSLVASGALVISVTGSSSR